MTKLRHLEPYGFNEQPQFNGLVNTVKANIENIKEKNQEQDKKDEEQDKKDEEQDENIKQAIDKSVVSLELLTTPTEGSNRTYAVKQGGNEIGKIEIPFSSLVKSTTYDAENNLLIFTIDNDKEIKVDLTNLIKDSDLVQRQLFDDFKNEVNSFSSNTTDSISELVQKLGSGFTGANTVTSVIERNEKVVSSSLNDLNDRKLDSSAYTPTDLSDYYKKEETSAKTELTTAFALKANASDLATHISDNIKHITSDERTKWDNATTTLATHTGNSTVHITADERAKWNGKISNAQYSSSDKKIFFYSGATTESPVANIDATDFIKDGMVSNVEIKNVASSGSCLVITFNADAGNQVITIPVSKIFDSGKYYLKTETSGKTEISDALSLKADTSALTTHTGNTDIHITADERTKWNNADANSHTHGNKAILDTITTIDSELSETSKNLVVNSAITKVIIDNEKIAASALNDLNDRKLDSSAYTPTDLSDYYKKEETSGKTDLANAFNSKANTSDLATKANQSDLTAHTGNTTVHINGDERTKWNNAKTTLDTHTGDSAIHITADERTKWNGKLSNVQYNKTDKKIYFYSGATTETPVLNIDATDFIKDGMVSNVEIKNVTNSGSCLVITFNADSGKQDINIPVSTIFNPANYYQKTELDAALALKANTSDLSNYYKKTETSGSTQLSTAFNSKADASHKHSSSDINDIVTAITESNSGSTSVPTVSAVMQVIKDNEKTIAASLNDLNDRIKQLETTIASYETTIASYETRIAALESKNTSSPQN